MCDFSCGDMECHTKNCLPEQNMPFFFERFFGHDNLVCGSTAFETTTFCIGDVCVSLP